MYRLRVFDASFREVDTIDRTSLDDLIHIGRLLQRAFGAYWRLEFVR